MGTAVEFKDRNTESPVCVRMQHTIAREASVSGVGIHTGKTVNMRILPAREGVGIAFRRVDLEASPLIPVNLETARGLDRHSALALGEDLLIFTPEHVLAALAALQIDNAIIEMDSAEPPVMDGSSKAFVQALQSAGISSQTVAKKQLLLQDPVYYSDGNTHIVAIPSDEFRVTFTLDYPQSSAIGTQFYSAVITPELFIEELAPCRTFCLYEEVMYMQEKGLIKGGSLDNALVFKGSEPVNEDGLRFTNEPVRHKVLDLIGDLSVLGRDLKAHVIAVRAGHKANIAFARRLQETR